MQEGTKNIYKKQKLLPCTTRRYKNLQNFKKVMQMHVDDTKNKNLYYYWVPSKPPTITVRACEDHKKKSKEKVDIKSEKRHLNKPLTYM